MNVLFVIPSKQGITGASMAMINIIIGLQRNGIESFVIASETPKEFQVFFDRLIENGVKLFMIPSEKEGLAYWKSLAKKALEIINDNDIMIIHLHLPKLVYVLGKDLKKMNKKIVLTVEGDPIYEVRNLGIITKIKMNIMWRKCKKYSDIFCPCSNWLNRIISERDKIMNIVTVHNPVDVSRFQKAEKNKSNIDKNFENKFLITTAARLTEVKDIDTLLLGYANFIEKCNPKSLLIILGEGEERKRLEELAAEKNIQDKVQFLGFKNNPQDYVKASDIFVMTSKYEPFGMPAAESGCLGIPTIVSKIGGLSEIIEDGVTGFHFKEGDHNELSKLFERLYLNKELRKELGKNAKKRIIENFSPEFIGKKFLKIYSNL